MRIITYDSGGASLKKSDGYFASHMMHVYGEFLLPSNAADSVTGLCLAYVKIPLNSTGTFDTAIKGRPRRDVARRVLISVRSSCRSRPKCAWMSSW